MRHFIEQTISHAASAAFAAGDLPQNQLPKIEVEYPKTAQHGDFSCNIAMKMSSAQKMAPRKIAEILLAHVSGAESIVEKTEIAGPGFINFFIRPSAWRHYLKEILSTGTDFGRNTIGQGQKIQVEFVSANPTGPLHVGHGRGAAVGDTVANILAFCGYDVQREYYVNDSGRQIRTLGLSVYLRYRQLLGEEIEFPTDCYQGDYIVDIARLIRQQHGDALLNQNKEDGVNVCARAAAALILAGIEEDLTDFGVRFDNWFSEQSLYDAGKVDGALAEMTAKDLIYLKDGAKWFRTAAYGDEKDRVVVRENGLTTYFASDIAYHHDKYKRGFAKVIDVWGADHHGYIPRVTAAITADGIEPERFHVILVQLVNLLRGGAPVAMSTRSGEFVTLKEVVQEVGRDAARFIFLTRHYDSPLDFDLELAKKKTNDNPVYYVQYVHARISSILRKGKEDKNIETIEWNEAAAAKLTAPEEMDLIKLLSRYPEIVAASAELLEPHRITFYLMELASAFHSYYNKHKVLTDDSLLTQGRLCLIHAIQKLIRNGLSLLGVSAPEKM